MTSYHDGLYSTHLYLNKQSCSRDSSDCLGIDDDHLRMYSEGEICFGACLVINS